MKKRIVSVLLALAIVVSLVPFSAFANEEEQDNRASSYLNMYTAALISKGIVGKLTLAFQVVATDDMDTVGVLEIIVRNNNGTIHSIILGSTTNGLLDSGTWIHAGSYTLNLTSGNTYYCTVVVIAQDANGGDTRRIITQRVTCP